MRVITAIKMGCLLIGFMIAICVTESYQLETINTIDYLRGMGVSLVMLAAGKERKKRWTKKRRSE